MSHSFFNLQKNQIHQFSSEELTILRPFEQQSTGHQKYSCTIESQVGIFSTISYMILNLRDDICIFRTCCQNTTLWITFTPMNQYVFVIREFRIRILYVAIKIFYLYIYDDRIIQLLSRFKVNLMTNSLTFPSMFHLPPYMTALVSAGMIWVSSTSVFSKVLYSSNSKYRLVFWFSVLLTTATK